MLSTIQSNKPENRGIISSTGNPLIADAKKRNDTLIEKSESGFPASGQGNHLIENAQARAKGFREDKTHQSTM
ncbi:MAG: hypothetical protein FP816_15685 [Desulfobacteraceae bacterium]|nr:hypothetical protein [Desulfobacteraceae bacterium]MBU3948961.1 hypothetical protein [Pseudomonadota bacterium]